MQRVEESQSMESISKKKTLKRKAEEISNESEAEDNEIPTAAADNSVVGCLCEDMVMGEVMPLIPWYNRPIMNRWCANSMIHSFPYYARLQNPRILSNCLVLYHHPQGSEYHNFNRLCIWVYSENEGTLLSIPVPTLTEDLSINAKFVRDYNGERIYLFAPINETGQEMYDVRVVDLREGNLQWKKLPPLPASEGHSVLSCASFDNGGCCTNYHIAWTKSRMNDLEDEYEDEDEDSYVWTLNTRNDITESLSQWQPELGASYDIIHKSIEAFGLGVEAPIYLEINIPTDTGPHSPKALYKLCADRHYCTEYNDTWKMPKFLLMQYHGDGHSEPRSILYYIRFFGGLRYIRCSMNFYKVNLDGENTKKLGDSEWDVFCDTWSNTLREENGTKATKVLWKRFPEWEMRTFIIDQVVDTEGIKLASRGPVYVYRLWKFFPFDKSIFE